MSDSATIAVGRVVTYVLRENYFQKKVGPNDPLSKFHIDNHVQSLGLLNTIAANLSDPPPDLSAKINRFVFRPDDGLADKVLPMVVRQLCDTIVPLCTPIATELAVNLDDARLAPNKKKAVGAKPPDKPKGKNKRAKSKNKKGS
jgi:hypothetical protein